MSNIHSLFPNKVKLEPVSHQYFDAEGRQYMSVSRLLNLMSERFEDTIAYSRADEATKAVWRQKGEDARNHGTRIHEALELYNQTGQILLENKDLEVAIKSITAEYRDYNKTHDEICLYNEKYRVAGTTDKICVISNRKDSQVDLADFKTNVSKGIYYFSEYGKRMFAPFEHLQDCNYVKYSFQLSIYAYFFEQLTGRKVRQMFIHFVPPDMSKHQKIPVLYLKHEVDLLLETYKNRILEILEPTQQTIVINEEEYF